MNLIRVALFWFAAAAVSLACVGPAWAQLRMLSEQELSAARGQGLLDLANSSANGFDFTRISLGADIKLNANFTKIQLGYFDPTHVDIDMPVLRFGSGDGTTGLPSVVKIADPYLEFVYTGTGAAREVVGMRLGFGSISGDVGLALNTLSGSLKIGNTIDVGGKRCTGACLAPLSAVGGVTATDSRDFWISALKNDVTFQPIAAAQTPAQVTAQAGFWLNWRDHLTAIPGAVPPNNLPLIH